MLVLTRKSQQRIRIGNDITVTILKLKGNAVSVGIDAPRNVRVVRGELTPHESPLTGCRVDGCRADGEDGVDEAETEKAGGEDDLQAATAMASSLRAFVEQRRKSDRYSQAS